MQWDWIISFVILTWLFLAIASKMTHQTIPEMLNGITDWIRGVTGDRVDDMEELYEGVTIYE